MKGYISDIGTVREVSVCSESFFAGNTCVGSIFFTASSGYWPSKKFLCPECGDVWGVRYFDTPRPEDHSTGWTCELRACANCGDGSLIDWTRDRPYILPKDLAYYELINSENWVGK